MATQRLSVSEDSLRLSTALGAPVDRRRQAEQSKLLEGCCCRQATGCCRQAQADRRFHGSGNIFLSTGGWGAVDMLICSEDWPSGLSSSIDGDLSCCRQGRVEEFLATGEAGDPHTKPFFFLVVSAETCTDSYLEVDQRVVWRRSWQLGKQEIPTPSCSSSPLCLLRPAQTVILKSTKGRFSRAKS
ncbi:hypothetical protein Taro_018411 [Colocasia esculenta]|uniref:Uncharacterized protein n=1 Tax=Colocasia esculenta TaxID=4460 RepID=A0A843V2B9_COLES|nr:hypothetical protein [Colocasia esculenta]